jgi:hypothetical protein
LYATSLLSDDRDVNEHQLYVDNRLVIVQVVYNIASLRAAPVPPARLKRFADDVERLTAIQHPDRHASRRYR